ncbi:MAG: HlyC/CorC family transporter [Planctomycetes bacterium]|nr:HlyC/CorC family transporter [Planctomycetota bacterium]
MPAAEYLLCLNETALAGALDPPRFDLASALAAVCALALGSGAALIRRSLAQSTPERVLESTPDEARRQRLAPLLGKVDRLTTSAAVIETTFALVFGIGVVRAFGTDGVVDRRSIVEGLLVCVPVLWFFTDALPRSLALHSGDAIVRDTLPAFRIVQSPIELFAWSFEAVRRGLLRLLGLHDDPESTRQIVAGLREVIEDSEITGRLDDAEKEIIGNVMEFRDVDTAAVMTPRTQVVAADVDEGLAAAARKLAESGHTRIPIYEGTLDAIIGTISARDIVQVAAAGRLEDTALRSIVHTAVFVPETKRVRELLAELRRAKAEMAIVLDEYGGTAGLVTVGDIVGEILGKIPDEYDEDAPSPVRRLPGGAAEVDAAMHVTEVNELFELDLPEQADFETLGGFVLAELGRFPARGEIFRRGGAEYAVLEADDRRVLKVRVRKLVGSEAN